MHSSIYQSFLIPSFHPTHLDLQPEWAVQQGSLQCVSHFCTLIYPFITLPIHLFILLSIHPSFPPSYSPGPATYHVGFYAAWMSSYAGQPSVCFSFLYTSINHSIHPSIHSSIYMYQSFFLPSILLTWTCHMPCWFLCSLKEQSNSAACSVLLVSSVTLLHDGRSQSLTTSPTPSPSTCIPWCARPFWENCVDQIYKMNKYNSILTLFIIPKHKASQDVSLLSVS